MKERYDVAVVGAGPAGLLAAKAIAENGFDVAVLERKTDMKAVTRSCGQSLLPPNEYFFGDLFHYNARDRRFCFPVMGLSFPYTGPVKSLLQKKLIKITGRKKVPGLPALYATTQEFLVYFGLNDLSELPSLEELTELFEEKEQPSLFKSES